MDTEMRKSVLLILLFGSVDCTLPTNTLSGVEVCMIPDSIYVDHVDQKTGDCADSLLTIGATTIDSGGMITQSIMCDFTQVNGCAINSTGCHTVADPGCFETRDITFAKDGSGFTGFIILDCSKSVMSNNCITTYQITSLRQ